MTDTLSGAANGLGTIASTSNPALPGIHAVLANYLMHWHKLAVDASLFVATGSLTVTGFTLSAETLDLRRGLVAIGLLAIIAGGGALVSGIVHTHVRTLRAMIQKIDEENGVFDQGFLKSGESLYPSDWRTASTNVWNDPISSLTSFAAVILPLLLGVVIAIYLFAFGG